MRKLMSVLLAASLLTVPVWAEESETEELTGEVFEVETEAVEETEAEEAADPAELAFGSWNLYQIDLNGETITDSADNGRFDLSYGGRLNAYGAIRGEGSYEITEDELILRVDGQEYAGAYEFFSEDEPHKEVTLNEDVAAFIAEDSSANRIKVFYTESYTDNSDPLAPKEVNNEYVYYLERDWQSFFLYLDDWLQDQVFSLASGAALHFYMTPEYANLVDMTMNGEMVQEGVTFTTIYNKLGIYWEQGSVYYVIDKIGPEGFTTHNEKDETSVLEFHYEGAEADPAEEAGTEAVEEESLTEAE